MRIKERASEADRSERRTVARMKTTEEGLSGCRSAKEKCLVEGKIGNGSRICREMLRSEEDVFDGQKEESKEISQDAMDGTCRICQKSGAVDVGFVMDMPKSTTVNRGFCLATGMRCSCS